MGKVLIVEDDIDIRNLITLLVDEAGHEALLAHDGQRGIDLARTEHPDLILMDLMLPQISGARASHIIKADPQTRKIPIIAMSAAENIRSQMGQMPIDGFMAKPFDVEDLLFAIDAMLGPPANH